MKRARRPAPGDPAQVAQPEGNDTLQEMFAPVGSALATTLQWGRELVNVSSDVLLHPTHALDYLLKGVDLTAEAAGLAFMPTDSPTCLKGTTTGIKRAAWTNRLPLEEIKAVAHATGCSVNDVVLCCVAGALRSYLAVKGDPLDNIEVRVLVPVNMRPAGEIGSLGSCFGLIAMLLPVSIDNPLERLYEVKRRMLELKASRPGFGDTWSAGRGWHGAESGATGSAGLAGQARHSSDDQCAGPAIQSSSGAGADYGTSVLYAPVRRHRHGNERSQL
jgi:hypothetical protein